MFRRERRWRRWSALKGQNTADIYALPWLCCRGLPDAVQHISRGARMAALTQLVGRRLGIPCEKSVRIIQSERTHLYYIAEASKAPKPV